MSRPATRRLPGDTAVGSRPEVQPRDRWTSWAICLCLTLAVWAVFGRTLRYEFVNYDDDVYVYENPAVTQGLSLPETGRAFTHQSGPDEWYPLTEISHMLDWQIFGANAGGHHLTNVLLHNATVLLLFLVLRNLTGATWRSAFVAAVFAIHPLRVQSVAWVTERKDVLSGMFFMLTLWAWTRYAQGVKRGKEVATVSDSSPVTGHPSLFYALALFFFALSLLAKSTPVMLPFVLLLLDYWPLGRIAECGMRREESTAKPSTLSPRLTTVLLEKTPFLLLSGVACVATALTQKGVMQVVQDLSLPWRAGNALLGCVVYLEHLFYPVGLALLYPHPARPLPVWPVAAAALVLFVISAGAIAGRRKYPYLAVGWLWYLVMLVPVIDIIQAGDQTRADRYTYLPQIGLYILIAWGAADLSCSWRHRQGVLGAAAAMILTGLLATAYAQTAYWKDSISLWTRTLACTPQSPIAQCNLGIALADRGKPEEALQHFRQALQLNPRDARSLDNSGKVLLARRNFNEAIQDFDRALQIAPDDIKAMDDLGVALAGEGKLAEAVQDYDQALQREPDDALVHYNLGNALVAQGKLDEARQHYERCVQLKPGFAEAQCNLGLVLARLGKLDEAVQHYRQALQLKPDYAAARDNLGTVLAAQQKMDQAAHYYEQALQLNPDNADAHNNLGVVLARRGKLDEAIRHFQRALAINPDDASAHDNLGIALVSQGKPDEARQQFQEALDLATARTNTALVNSILTRLKSLPPAASRPQSP